MHSAAVRTGALISTLAAWNVVINRVVRPAAYVPANLAMTAVTLWQARRAGASWQDLGLNPRSNAASAPVAVGTAAGVAAGIWLAARLPATARLFDDDRVNTDDVGYQAFVRIPFGTVTLEEVAFRGVLPAVIGGPGRTRVSMTSAVLFGLWHVLPTLATMEINGVHNPRLRSAAVATGVAATALVAVGFDALRLHTGSVGPPIMAHWSANAASYAIAARRRRADERGRAAGTDGTINHEGEVS